MARRVLRGVTWIGVEPRVGAGVVDRVVELTGRAPVDAAHAVDQAADLLDAIQTGRNPLVTGIDGLRALEVCLKSGRPFSEQRGQDPPPYRVLLIGLTMEREALYARVDARVDAMIEAGLVEEVCALNGTFVNGEQVVTGEPHPIADGDKISFGMVNLVFRS